MLSEIPFDGSSLRFEYDTSHAKKNLDRLPCASTEMFVRQRCGISCKYQKGRENLAAKATEKSQSNSRHLSRGRSSHQLALPFSMVVAGLGPVEMGSYYGF